MKEKNQKAQILSAKAKANKDSFENLLNSEIFAESANDLKNRFEGQKHSIYKRSVFEGLTTDREFKKKRKILRSTLQSKVKEFFTNKERASELMKAFLTYYKDTYLINDFSIDSVTSSEKTKNDKNLVLFMRLAKIFNSENS